MANNRSRIVVTEIPYMVNKAKLVEKIAELLENNEVVVRDPNSREKSAVTWEYDRVMEQANYVWAYTYG